MTQDLIYKERGAISPFILVTQFTLCHDLVITLPVPLWTLMRRLNFTSLRSVDTEFRQNGQPHSGGIELQQAPSLSSYGLLLCCLPCCWCLPGTKRLPSTTHAVGCRQYFIHVKGKTEGFHSCSSVIECLSSMHQQEVQSPAPHPIPKWEISEKQ